MVLLPSALVKETMYRLLRVHSPDMFLPYNQLGSPAIDLDEEVVGVANDNRHREYPAAHDGRMVENLRRKRIEDMGHRIRFSVSRGPFNIAAFLMGMTEFLMALKTSPAPIHGC